LIPSIKYIVGEFKFPLRFKEITMNLLDVGHNTIIPEVSKMRVELRGPELVQGVLADGLMVIVWSCEAIV
jgi:hypothetical protein